MDNDDDCDDSDILLSPAEIEVCDGIDNNCNGEIDDDDQVLGSDPECPADDCEDISAVRDGLSDGTYFFDDGIDTFADECDFGSPPDEPDWSSEIRPMLTTYCTDCHRTGSAAAGLNLQTTPYYKIVDEPSTQVPIMNRVERGSAAQSYLWHKLMGTHDIVDGEGDQKPVDGFMPPDDLKKFTDWINAGANN